MPNAQPLPVRILVKGASTVGWMSGDDNPRSALGFSREAQAELARRGRPAEVRTISVPSERTKSTLAHWQDEVIGFSPDVVVLVYGHYETIHLFLPWRLERHANSLKARPRALSGVYRRRVLRPVWMALAKLQSRLDGYPRISARRRRLRQTARDLTALIRHLQSMNSPLVFVFELLPPTPRYASWFPGMAARIGAMNAELRGAVAELGRPDVRFFPVRVLVDQLGGDLAIAIPDGFHYSPELHRLIGVELGRAVDEWALSQPHLALPD